MRTCGLISTYQAGCRCPECREAAARSRAASRARATPPAGETTAASMTWMDHAACNGLNPDFFHPERNELAHQAKAVCRACAVQTACLEWALATNQRFGVWGGRSRRERDKLAKAQAGHAVPDAVYTTLLLLIIVGGLHALGVRI